jgi:hypothetical protein
LARRLERVSTIDAAPDSLLSFVCYMLDLKVQSIDLRFERKCSLCRD